jgi:mannosylglycerate hydrolase
VPHTHWDREWHEPFQELRVRLVDGMDALLGRLEADPSQRILLDGQAALLDDYLEARPDAEASLRRLGASGRLEVGPWYVLMDEFLVSGETLVRNLQMGIERAAAFGGAMPVGYLPDSFGHVSQMPQLLRQAGLEHAVVWRGVPAAVDRTAFWWAAPDGSTVRGEYLVRGYGNGAAVPEDATALVRRVALHEEEIRSFLLDGILLMCGTDHRWPEPWIGRVVSEANLLQEDFEMEVTSLARALSLAPLEGLPRWAGELRSGARSPLLAGVASNRLDVKQAAARSERLIERQAEPLSALFLPEASWPAELLREAWRRLVLNSAHDSICACSADPVADAVLLRYLEAGQLGEALTRRALRCFAASLEGPGTTVLNSSARTRAGTLEVVLPAESLPEGAQLLGTQLPLPEAEDPGFAGAEGLRSLLGALRGPELSPGAYLSSISTSEDEHGLTVTVRVGSSPDPDARVEEAKRELYSLLGGGPPRPVRVEVVQPRLARALVRVEGVPGFGWKPLVASAPAHPVRVDDAGPGGPALDNGLTRVVVSALDGTLQVDSTAGLNRLVDSGDVGDTYTHCPPLEDTVVEVPDNVETRVVERGPLRAQLEVLRTYRLPERADPASGKRVGEAQVPITSLVELRADERLVRIETSFDNRVCDHRLRAVFPLPEPAGHSDAECAFAVVRRPLEAEGGPAERSPATFPSRRFVSAGGLTLLHEGLPEYELLQENGRAQAPPRAGKLALTLVRSTGMLSRTRLPCRPAPAGPPLPLEGAQMQGPLRCRYALVTGPVDPYAAADEAFLPLLQVRSPGGGARPSSGRALCVEGAEVSAVRREGRTLEVRVFNPTSSATVATVEGRSGSLVDLRGRALGRIEGAFELAPWQIATARLEG